ncbi:MAG: pyridoxal-phosphate dependent enzyme [Chitinophagaceae bacterium]|nr:pyridoxal-phosphate dependent enzyme [Chitinophagaceae bacterium]
MDINFLENDDIKITSISLSNSKKNIDIDILRLDKIHETISGNKWFKLKYNLLEAKNQNVECIISFGGAFSNHLHALAFAGKKFGLKTIGIVRGEKVENETLNDCKNWGMELHFISREAYRSKTNLDFLEKLNIQFPNSFIIPEGGENDLGIKGCEEILKNIEPRKYDKICCAVGTATTMIGMLKSTETDVIGFAALKNAGYMIEKIKQQSGREQIELIDDIYFGGFGKWNNELIHFIEEMELNHNLKLDKVYTAKLFYNVIKKIETAENWQHNKILIIHSGGLQGNRS